MSLRTGDGKGDELETNVPTLLYLKNSASLLNETYALNIHTIAKATVDEVAREALEELTQATADATQWLTGGVRRELISQAVSDAEPLQPEKMEKQKQLSHLEPFKLQSPGTKQLLTSIHAVAEATVAAVREQAVKDIVQVVERATAWISQAVANDIVSSISVDPDDGLAFHNATEWITHAVRSELIAQAVIDVAATDSEEQEAIGKTQEIVTAHNAPQLSLLDGESSDIEVHAFAKKTVEEAVSRALHKVVQATHDASKWLTQAVRGELLAKAVVDASVINAPEEPQHSLSIAEDADASVHVSALQIPSAAGRSSETAVEGPELAESLGFPEPEEYTDDADDAYDDYTPINSPTAEEAPSKTLTAVFGRATPPDTKPTPRKSPNTSKRGLGTPTSEDNSPSLAFRAKPSSPIVDGTQTEVLTPAHSTLPPLILPEVQLTGRAKLHQKTPRRSSTGSNEEEKVYMMNSPRSSPSQLSKQTSRASVAVAELELTSLSSARAAVLIYAQQPPSSRRHCHHHHNPKKLRDSASQTSPPPSPPFSSLPRQLLLGTQDDCNDSELPKTSHSSHSPRDLLQWGNNLEKKADRSNNTKLAPLSKPSTISGSSTCTKSSSPSRTRTNHRHSHTHKGHEGSPSPNKRSGYCQRCVFEGRSCKINDCLKHQVLK